MSVPTTKKTKDKPETSPPKQLSLLAQFGKGLKPKDGLPIFKFEEIDDTIVAEFIRWRSGINTKLQSNADVVDLNIIECSDGTTIGERTIFLSTHLKKIFTEYQFTRGDRFILKLCEIDEESGFKLCL